MAESSEDDIEETNSDDSKEDNVELQDHIYVIEFIVKNQNLGDVPLDTSDYEDDYHDHDDIPLAF